jgi:hypothetical protein
MGSANDRPLFANGQLRAGALADSEAIRTVIPIESERRSDVFEHPGEEAAVALGAG